MKRFIIISIFSVTIAFPQSDILSKDQISTIKKLAYTDAMEDFTFAKRLGWTALGTSPALFHYLIPFNKNYYFKTIGFLMFGVPISTLMTPIKIPENKLLKIENESELFKQSYHDHYRKVIIIERIIHTIPIEIIGLMMISRPMVVYN
ncbi:MAG: hypothetical protein ISR82_08590 [Candidatus Marinimicrobia bacterium]|nr:hypothetical protein [Candidatus Neomarinimicrobiota bacterium]MBL7011265.1 hypothetical protein [Candidatus Neomarinimicrobiota bacterium]MBL7031256.1 hypothetical protein [Candidatus Neomarinimicrobiota bacterium]